MEPATIPLATVHGRPRADLGITDASGRPGTVRALVDTGGGSLVMRREVADRLGLAIGHTVEVAGGELTTVEPPALWVGDVELDTDGVAAYAAGDEMVTGVEGEGIDVVLPAAVLRRHAVVLDYPAGELTVGPTGSIPHRGVPVPLDVHPGSGFGRLQVEVGGAVIGLLLDTGPSCCLIGDRVFREWIGAHPDWPTSAASIGPANMAGLAFEASAPVVRVAGVRIGPFELPGVAFAWRHDDAFESLTPGVTQPVVGAIGGNVLQHFRVAIDVEKGYVHLEQGRPFAEPDADMAGIVVGVAPDGGYLVLATITGLDEVQVNDRLLAVDGEAVAPLSLGQVVDRLRGVPAETVHHLTVERDGRMLEVAAPVLRVF